MPKPLPLIDATLPLCCAPLGQPTADAAADAAEIAARLRALADPGRLLIVRELARCEGHELTTTEASALLGVTEATANHHLKRMEAAGLVVPRRDGQHVRYRLNIAATQAVADSLKVRCAANCC